MPPKKKTTPIEVDATRHTSDTRVNIPTNELRDFAQEDELQPYPVIYKRDPSLDPQLVWNGKDEQDSRDLIVPAVPIYIQEKIQPEAIIEEVRRYGEANAAPVEQQMSLFSDFNGIDFEQLIQFYQHSQHWTNRMILGDSLLVMNSLAEKEGMKGKVQMVYLDPPYGIEFGSNWQVSTRKNKVQDGKAEDLIRQPEQIRAFRDTWEKGIHSYLSYLRDRLVVARELLAESGSVFVQIGNQNVHLIRSILDEVFGSENSCGLIAFKKTGAQTTNLLPPICDYIVWYAKNIDVVKYHQLFKEMIPGEGHSTGERYDQVLFPDGSRGPASSVTEDNTEARYFRHVTLSSNRAAKAHERFSVAFQGRSFLPPENRTWSTTQTGFRRLMAANRVYAGRDSLNYVKFLDDFPANPLGNLWEDFPGVPDKIYVVQTNAKIIARCILMTTDPGDLVLDPTMGSGTTAYVAEQWGRRWITIDTSRVALALARTRLMSARYPYYLLADSPEGAQKEMELLGTIFPTRAYKEDIKAGFVYELVPHITLRDIANNEEIDTIHAQWQPYLEERRMWLKQSMGQAWEEWQVPRELPDANTDVQQVLGDYWQARRERQKQMDESIARNSEREILYDRPYEDKKKIRVAGAFTVETLSPHRILDPGYAETAARTDMANVGSYEQMVIDNLRHAGVQNTVRGERLKFDTLEPFASAWIHAVGTYTDASGEERRVAVSIGSEHGTVGARQVQQAAKEAVKGLGHDLLLVCGFAFDAVVSEEAKRYGKLDVQIVRMNSELMMGDILRQTDRANLFMIFGEPDVVIERQPDGRYIAEIRGLDIYDPTTGQIRSSSTDEIACWFIDTNYNEESFFVRHAYFVGDDDAYDNLKRALRADIDESAWSALYSTRSLPFDRPDDGRIAVKVINHYGDEVLKVYRL